MVFVCLEPILCTTCFYWLSLSDYVCVFYVCVYREQVQRSEESSPSLSASLRHQSMKQSPSQHSFDSAILEGSLPDENLSVDSDVSDNFFVLMDSGAQNTSKQFSLNDIGDLYYKHVSCFQSQVWSPCVLTTLLLAAEAVQLQEQKEAHQLTLAALCHRVSRMYHRIW